MYIYFPCSDEIFKNYISENVKANTSKLSFSDECVRWNKLEIVRPFFAIWLVWDNCLHTLRTVPDTSAITFKQHIDHFERFDRMAVARPQNQSSNRTWENVCEKRPTSFLSIRWYPTPLAMALHGSEISTRHKTGCVPMAQSDMAKCPNFASHGNHGNRPGGGVFFCLHHRSLPTSCLRCSCLTSLPRIARTVCNLGARSEDTDGLSRGGNKPFGVPQRTALGNPSFASAAN